MTERHTPLRLGQQVTAWSHLPKDIEAMARAASMIDPVNPCLDAETEADMARAYYEALQTHLRAHGCHHNFADVADHPALTGRPEWQPLFSERLAMENMGPLHRRLHVAFSRLHHRIFVALYPASPLLRPWLWVWRQYRKTWRIP